MKSILLYGSLAVVIIALVIVLALGGLGSMNQTASVVTGTLTSLTNVSRADENLYGLAYNETLAQAASAKAADMAAKGYFSHTGPDGSRFWHWVRDAGYEYAYVGENLAINFNESEDVVNAWLNSPAHRANIMSAKFTEVGIGMATGTYKGKTALFIVQMFGTPVGGAVPDSADAKGNGASFVTSAE